METQDFEIYKGKSFKDLCKDICINQNRRKDQLESSIADLKNMIKSINDALMLVPLIKEYLDASISNDEHLIKLAQICQRIMTASQGEGNNNNILISDEEKEELMRSLTEVTSPIPIKNISNNNKKDNIIIES